MPNWGFGGFICGTMTIDVRLFLLSQGTPSLRMRKKKVFENNSMIHYADGSVLACFKIGTRNPLLPDKHMHFEGGFDPS